MSSLETGIYGAKVQSWRNANPRDVLKQIIDSAVNPNDRPAIHSALREKVLREGDEDYLDSIIEYWFTNNYNSLMLERSRPRLRTSALALQAARAAEYREKVTTAIRQEAIFLLGTILPNGKALRDSTFGECAKIGGVLSKIASKGKPEQIVGEVLSDAQLHKLQGI